MTPLEPGTSNFSPAKPIADLYAEFLRPFSHLAHFSEAALEGRLVSRNGKDYLKCLVPEKEVLAKPGEVALQLWLHTLIHKYEYPVSRIQVEYPMTFGRDASKRADIAVMDRRPTNRPLQFDRSEWLNRECSPWLGC